MTWGYDAGDNLTSIGDTASGTTSTFSYDVAHELTGLTTTVNGAQTHNVTYGYNPDGDRTSSTDSVAPASNATYGYDQADRLTSYSQGSTSASYTYNGDGLRVAKTVNGTTTSYVWDLAEGMPLLLQETTNGTAAFDIYPLISFACSLLSSAIDAFWWCMAFRRKRSFKSFQARDL
jgi:YD repeat-containing protein